MLEAIAESCAPKRLAGIDPSAGFLDFARWRLGPDRAELRQADARELPFATAEFDRVVSGLVLKLLNDFISFENIKCFIETIILFIVRI